LIVISDSLFLQKPDKPDMFYSYQSTVISHHHLRFAVSSLYKSSTLRLRVFARGYFMRHYFLLVQIFIRVPKSYKPDMFYSYQSTVITTRGLRLPLLIERAEGEVQNLTKLTLLGFMHLVILTNGKDLLFHMRCFVPQHDKNLKNLTLLPVIS